VREMTIAKMYVDASPTYSSKYFAGSARNSVSISM